MTEVSIALVVAVARNGAIGKDGDMPWHLPGELAYFKRITMGKPILMGRRTWQSLPRRPLPGRPNLVVTRDDGFSAEGAERFSTLDEALDRGAALASDLGVEELAIIGGAQIYAACLPRATRIYLTEIDAEPDADTFFPPINPDAWQETARQPGRDPQDGAPGYSYVILDRVAWGASNAVKGELNALSP